MVRIGLRIHAGERKRKGWEDQIVESRHGRDLIHERKLFTE
jgi:hypothetical protein